MPLGLEQIGHRDAAVGYVPAAGMRYVQAQTAPSRVAAEAWSAHLAAPTTLRLIPDGCVEIVADAERGTLIYGPSSRHRVLSLTPGRRLGLRLRPEAASLLLEDPRAWADRVLPAAETALGDLASDVPGSWQRSALEQLEAIGAGQAVDPAASWAVSRLRGNQPPDVDALAAELGLSTRQLRRRFVAAVGVAPATFRSVARLNHAVRCTAQPRDGSLARLAAELGYSDQSHLGREMRRLTGLSPTALRAAAASGPA